MNDVVGDADHDRGAGAVDGPRIDVAALHVVAEPGARLRWLAASSR